LCYEKSKLPDIAYIHVDGKFHLIWNLLNVKQVLLLQILLGTGNLAKTHWVANN
jgi:hypothetical protein